GVFDAIIREEQRQQRASRREQGAAAQSSVDSGTEQEPSGRNPYEGAEGLLVVVLADARAPRRRHPRSSRHPKTSPPVMTTTSSHGNLEKRQCASQTLRSVKRCGTSTENTKVLRYPTND
ncbi:hypothetical protein N9V36_07145, partial [Luminiphilus sp.]|nr:hypothetical protein [Luminiphilus sp.]